MIPPLPSVGQCALSTPMIGPHMNTQPHSWGIQPVGWLKVRWFAALWYVVHPAVGAAAADGVADGVAVAVGDAVAVAEGDGSCGAAPHPVSATSVIAAHAGARRRRRVPVGPCMPMVR